jgi:hypothetical protein
VGGEDSSQRAATSRHAGSESTHISDSGSTGPLRRRDGHGEFESESRPVTRLLPLPGARGRDMRLSRLGNATAMERRRRAPLHLRPPPSTPLFIYAPLHLRASPSTPLSIYAPLHLRSSPSTLLSIYAPLHLRSSPSTLLSIYAPLHLRPSPSTPLSIYAPLHLRPSPSTPLSIYAPRASSPRRPGRQGLSRPSNPSPPGRPGVRVVGRRNGTESGARQRR